MDSKYDSYRAALKRTLNPTDADMVAMCPHLTPIQAVEAFRSGSCVACPPLRISGACHAAHYFGGSTDDRLGKLPPSLDQGYIATADHQCLYVREAMDYAREHWGSRLIRKTWLSSTDFYVDDTADLRSGRFHRRRPHAVASYTVGLSRSVNDIINDYSAPQSTLFDDAIVELTDDYLVGKEIKVVQHFGPYAFCSQCCGGLDLTRCHGCKRTFDDTMNYAGCTMPMPPKVVAHLRAKGHVFESDLVIVRKEEMLCLQKNLTDIARRQ